MPPRQRIREGEVELHAGPVRYALFNVAGRRYVHLLVDDDARLLVRAPWHYRQEAAEHQIREHGQWVTDQLERARRRRGRRPDVVDGARLPLLDGALTLAVTLPPGQARGRARRLGDVLRIEAPAADPVHIRAAVEGWYRAEARRVFTQRLSAFGRELALAPRRLRVAGQRTCWGSCSDRGTVSLNWRLMFLPSELVDYVVVHELCHLRHLDHSARFWSLVASVVPDHRARRAELRRRQGQLPL